MNTGRVHRRTFDAAFTIVELLIVMGVIVLLLSILIVAVQAATRTAQTANTRGLMNSIKQALVQFERDIGYLPPVLGHPAAVDDDPANHDFRRIFDPRGLDFLLGNSDDCLPRQGFSNYAHNVQNWFSVTSLAEYLIGYGNHREDGYGVVPGVSPIFAWSSETPSPGIRHPGPDGVWGATNGTGDGLQQHRMGGPVWGSSTAPHPFDHGKVYGPYLVLEDERLLASASIGGSFTCDTDADCPTGPCIGDPNPGDGIKQGGCEASDVTISFPGESHYDADDPKVIVDYWGSPIRYYRRPYAPGSLTSAFQTFDPDVPAPSLSDIFVLRPYHIKPGSVIDSIYGDDSGDTGTTTALSSAAFALFSPGPDRGSNRRFRVDAPDYYNEDNIVELGP